MPLSTLELFDKYGYKEVLADFKDLVSTGKIELLGGAAYHAFLPAFSPTVAEQQSVANEFGLGYYLGARQGFDGEDAIMMRNVSGYFPPEMAINDTVLATLSSLSYPWVLADETCLPDDIRKGFSPSVFAYSVAGKSTHVVVRNRELSNMLAFKRDLSTDDFLNRLKDVSANAETCLIALDAETFGHHYKEGVALLDVLTADLHSSGVRFVTPSHLISYLHSKKIHGLIESSWGASDKEIAEGNPFPYWINPTNKLQESLLKVMTVISESVFEVPFDIAKPFWLPSSSDETNNVSNFMKVLCSDTLWWASKLKTYDNITLYDKNTVKSFCELAESIVIESNDKDVKKVVTKHLNEVAKHLNEVD